MGPCAPHAESGAVFAEYGCWRLPAHYAGGSAVEEEYAALGEAGGLTELSERALLAVSGPLRQKFLHGLLSNDVTGLSAGQGCEAALMTVKGGLVATLRVVVDANEVVLELPAERLERVEQLLTHYRVGAPVRFAARRAAVLMLAGPGAGALVRSVAGTALPEAGAHVDTRIADAPVRVIHAADAPGGGLVTHLEAQSAPAVWRALVAAGARPVGREALNARRIEAGRPWYGFDITDQNLLHETGLLGALHSSSKGCYVGQEVVARLEGRGGRVNKALRGLRLGAPAEPGTILRAGDRAVGSLTTCAVSPRHGPIALGYVHRDSFELGTTFDAAGRTATLVELPFPEERA